jgi:hypothetical protein
VIVRSSTTSLGRQPRNASILIHAIYALLPLGVGGGDRDLPNALVLIYFSVLAQRRDARHHHRSSHASSSASSTDTIHFIVRFREQAAVLQDEKKATVEALRIVARPVASTNIALAAGFLALAVSGLRHQVEFAVLASVMLLLGWFIDMTFTPALCAGAGVTKKAGC